MYFYHGKNAYSSLAYWYENACNVKGCVAAIGVVRFSVRSFGCALFYLKRRKEIFTFNTQVSKQIERKKKMKKTVILSIIAIMCVSMLFLSACSSHICDECGKESEDVKNYCLQTPYIDSQGHIDYEYSYEYLCPSCADEARSESILH